MRGGIPLHGVVNISTSKNATLPLMAAALLIPGEVRLKNTPKIADIYSMVDVLKALGAETSFDNGDLHIRSEKLTEPRRIEYDVSRHLRTSVLAMGPLLARFGKAVVSRPGGCSIGSRPIDYHIRGLQALGADIREEHGYIFATVKGKLAGASIQMPYPSVGATENALMASVLAHGVTEIDNAAQDPEVVDLCRFLIAAGADVEGVGTSRLRVTGVTSLKPMTYQAIPDRIEAGTYLCAGAITRGEIFAAGAEAGHLRAFLDALSAAGCSIGVESGATPGIRLKAPQRPKPVDFKTLSYPGFPTDLQPPMMALMAVADGKSAIVESVFERRFLVADELARMGAKIRVEKSTAIIDGVRELTGAPVEATDIRAGGALVVAALAASGQSEIRGLHHIERGYENFSGKLKELGALISVVTPGPRAEKSGAPSPARPRNS